MYIYIILGLDRVVFRHAWAETCPYARQKGPRLKTRDPDGCTVFYSYNA